MASKLMLDKKSPSHRAAAFGLTVFIGFGWLNPALSLASSQNFGEDTASHAAADPRLILPASVARPDPGREAGSAASRTSGGLIRPVSMDGGQPLQAQEAAPPAPGAALKPAIEPAPGRPVFQAPADAAPHLVAAPDQAIAPPTFYEIARHVVDRARSVIEAAWFRPETWAIRHAPDSALIPRLGRHIDWQLAKMARIVDEDELAELAAIRSDAHAQLETIDKLLKKRIIDPAVQVRLAESDPRRPIVDRTIKLAVYPVAGDSLHWRHLLTGLQAIAERELDTVVFIVAGDDSRKKNMSPAARRHPMGRYVLDPFSRLFRYSPIALGTELDGETNIFRLLALNAAQSIEAHYLVGDDHYKRFTANGAPDTIEKMERNLAARLHGFNPRRHSVKIAFIIRDGIGEKIETPLEPDISFLERMSFDAASTDIRNGRHGKMPYDAYRYASADDVLRARYKIPRRLGR